MFDGEWHHIFLTANYSAKTSRLYVDGALVVDRTSLHSRSPVMDMVGVAMGLVETDTATAMLHIDRRFFCLLTAPD